MNKIIHWPTCAAWVTNELADCNCQQASTWRIRKEPHEAFPWRIWRHTGDDVYEPLMSCSSFEKAHALVRAFEDLVRLTAVRNDV